MKRVSTTEMAHYRGSQRESEGVRGSMGTEGGRETKFRKRGWRRTDGERAKCSKGRDRWSLRGEEG